MPSTTAVPGHATLAPQPQGVDPVMWQTMLHAMRATLDPVQAAPGPSGLPGSQGNQGPPGQQGG